MDKAAEGHSKHKNLYQGFEVHLCSSFYTTDTFFKVVLYFCLSQICHIDFIRIGQSTAIFQKIVLITIQTDNISNMCGTSWRCSMCSLYNHTQQPCLPSPLERGKLFNITGVKIVCESAIGDKPG